MLAFDCVVTGPRVQANTFGYLPTVMPLPFFLAGKAHILLKWSLLSSARAQWYGLSPSLRGKKSVPGKLSCILKRDPGRRMSLFLPLFLFLRMKMWASICNHFGTTGESNQHREADRERRWTGPGLVSIMESQIFKSSHLQIPGNVRQCILWVK